MSPEDKLGKLRSIYNPESTNPITPKRVIDYINSNTEFGELCTELGIEDPGLLRDVLIRTGGNLNIEAFKENIEKMVEELGPESVRFLEPEDIRRSGRIRKGKVEGAMSRDEAGY